MDYSREKTKHVIQKIIGILGESTAVLLFGAGIITANPLLIASSVIAVPSIIEFHNGNTKNYLKNVPFSINCKAKITYKDENNKKVSKKCNTINQKLSAAPIDLNKISSKKVYKEEVKRLEEKYKSQPNYNKAELKNAKKELKKNYENIRKKMISSYYAVSLLNTFNQLRQTDEKNNEVTFGFNSHGVTLKALEKLSKGDNPVIKDIEKHNAKKKNMIVEKIMLGNFRLKDIKKTTTVYDVTFKLTGKKIDDEYIRATIGNSDIYDEVILSDGTKAYKLNEDKIASTYKEKISTINSCNTKVFGNVSNIKLSKENMTRTIMPSIATRKEELISSLKQLKNNVLNLSNENENEYEQQRVR